MPHFPPAVPSKLPEEHPLCTARSSPEPLSFCLIVFLQRPPSHSLPFDLQLTRSRCLPYIALGGSGQLLKCTSPALCDLRHQFRLCSPALPVPSLRRWVLLVFCSSLLGSAGTPRVLITGPSAEFGVPSGSLGLCLSSVLPSWGVPGLRASLSRIQLQSAGSPPEAWACVSKCPSGPRLSSAFICH